ncbi:MAG TPA: hypothetical protein VHB21_25935 [Minicystis sp.]|nr:hypothetical protein [Minicystis sp.]
MRIRYALVLLTAVAAVPLVNPGCSKYGEGQPCSVDNNDPVTGISNDCQDGLVCFPAGQLHNCNDTDICCPPSGATNPACIPGALNCGTGGGGGSTGASSLGGFGGTSGTGGTGGTGGMSGCAHDKCVAGAKLDPACNDCVAAVCDQDPICCVHAWDATCVSEVNDTCSKKDRCNAGTGGSGGGTGGTTSTTTSPTGSGGTTP